MNQPRLEQTLAQLQRLEQTLAQLQRLEQTLAQLQRLEHTLAQLQSTWSAITPDFSSACTQISLMLQYQTLLRFGKELPSLKHVGFKVYSQTDEDGILLYIFSLIGVTNRMCVEICAGNGLESNTTNLILHHYWTALLFDGNADNVDMARRFFREHRATYVYPPIIVHSWITRENVNGLIRDHGFQGDIDLLSLDLDGVDYWIWEAITAITPRVVVLEYQDILGPDRSWTVPYKEDFRASDYPCTDGMPNFAGGSLRAFVNLGKKKGYRLVGCNALGYNAFFIRNGIGEESIPEIAIDDCFRHPKVLWGMQERFPRVKDLPWLDLEAMDG
jgi:hypothetical protein